ncbi:hypothetical protein [Streptomyces sp. ISL-11]|uniref:hypothetical protein n=1 Tax=Streptomyces sp. ISL-11 TaxID=2819174 RepID=UPI001BE7BAB5|nr:hypothetical protein [Streptomyces sp. ISL-11]MBT2382962.1 hypothetical protein [Streptomyces sp. ISL-11]
MVVVALLLPPLLLCGILAMGRYEERLLGAPDADADTPRHGRRHLRVVPGPPSREPSPADSGEDRARHAA